MLNLTIKRENSEIVNIRLVNILSSVVISNNFNCEERTRIIDLKNLTDGVYILYIQIGKEQYQQRIILQK